MSTYVTKGLEYIRNIFGANGMTQQVKAVDAMVDTRNTLINATVEGKDIEKREEISAEATKNEDATAEEAKGDDNIVDWFNRGLATYIDKEKALDYLHHSALNAEALSNPRLISTTKVIQNFQNPKIEAKYALSTAPTFYSNAEFAVRGIKQEKATPEQWLKMIEKNGGLNAGEVEARNVSARINMTPEERRATLLSETEDVAR